MNIVQSLIPENIVITITCFNCHSDFAFDIPQQDYIKFLKCAFKLAFSKTYNVAVKNMRDNARYSFPYFNKNERELFLSGMCYTCK